MVKKTIVLTQSDIDYVWEYAKRLKSKGAKRGDFSKGLRYIINEHKNGKNNRTN